MVGYKSLVSQFSRGPMSNFFKTTATAGGDCGGHVLGHRELTRSDPEGPRRRSGHTLGSPEHSPPNSAVQIPIKQKTQGLARDQPAAEAGGAERSAPRGPGAPPCPSHPAHLPACRRGAAPLLQLRAARSGLRAAHAAPAAPSPLAAARQQQVSIKVLVRSRLPHSRRAQRPLQLFRDARPVPNPHRRRSSWRGVESHPERRGAVAATPGCLLATRRRVPAPVPHKNSLGTASFPLSTEWGGRGPTLYLLLLFNSEALSEKGA